MLRDAARDRLVPESSVDHRVPGAAPSRARCALVPADPDAALRVRLADRFYDAYVHEPMQKIVTDTLRPPGRGDPHGVEEARALLATAYGMIEAEMAGRHLGGGRGLHHGRLRRGAGALLRQLGAAARAGHPSVAAYLARLRARPSFARVVEEARPYRHLFPAKRLRLKRRYRRAAGPYIWREAGPEAA